MTAIDSGACRTSGGAGQTAATQASNGLRGSSFQDRADALVRATVLSDLGQGAGLGRHSHGIQGIAAAIRKVLSAQDVTGTDASDDVLKKIETSLHKAAQALADRGVDAKTIDATIDRFRAQLADALDRMDGASGSAVESAGGSSVADGASAGSSGVDGSSTGSAGATSAAGGSSSNGGTGATSGSGSSASGAVATSGNGGSAPAGNTTSVSKFVSREVRKERGAIDLVTAEGDHVSIRFRSKDVVTGSAVQATGSDGTSVSAAKSSLFSRGGVKVEVDGDLNDDELKAINDLLGKVDDIATKFYSGDVQAAFSAASSLGVDSDQIAAYRLDVTYSRKVAAAYSAASVASLPASTQTPASSPVQAPTSAPVQAPASSTSANSSTANSTTKAAAFAAALSQRYWSATRLVISASGSSVGAPTSASSSSSSVPSSAADSSDAIAPTPAADSSDVTAPPSTIDSSAAAASSSTAPDDAPSTSATNADAASPTANATDDLPAAAKSDTPAASPASAQKTIIDFINDTLSKLGSASGAGRVSFSLHWKINALATALDSVQPAQPTTPTDQTAAANTQLLNDSLQKIAAT